ncbi:MAG: hypothetical protein LBS83_00320 [Holosporales bacterium]|jgi:hypothetical protein|nr:hypothetical protein [Holosporales bacterium]
MNINMKKFFKLGIFAAGLAAVCFVKDLRAAAPAAGTTTDPRQHLFFSQKGRAPKIDDEGFRWRNSLGFTVDFGKKQQDIPAGKWFFDRGTRVGRGGNMTFVLANFTNIAAGINVNADGIHDHLSNIVAVGMNAAGTNQAAAAAITIVIKNPNNDELEAYSEVIRDSVDTPAGGVVQNQVAISIPRSSLAIHNRIGITGAGLSMYYADAKLPARAAQAAAVAGYLPTVPLGAIERCLCTTANLVGVGFQLNVPPIPAGAGGYGCCEGQIISRLFDTDPPVVGGAALQPLFPQVIGHLIQEANTHKRNKQRQITGANIVLVVLHIHTHFDPCAKCSKVLSGLSRQMNMPEYSQRNPDTTQTVAMTNFLNGALVNNPLLTNLRNGKARFLIEVSSDDDYLFYIDGGGTHKTYCSFAHSAGKDKNSVQLPVSPVNVTIKKEIPFKDDGSTLAIQDGVTGNNWKFSLTFPPYLVYKRIVPGVPLNNCEKVNNLSSKEELKGNLSNTLLKPVQ